MRLATARHNAILREVFALYIRGRAAVLRSDYAEAQRIFLESARRWELAGTVLRTPLAILSVRARHDSVAFERSMASGRMLVGDATVASALELLRSDVANLPPASSGEAPLERSSAAPAHAPGTLLW